MDPIIQMDSMEETLGYWYQFSASTTGARQNQITRHQLKQWSTVCLYGACSFPDNCLTGPGGKASTRDTKLTHDLAQDGVSYPVSSQEKHIPHLQCPAQKPLSEALPRDRSFQTNPLELTEVCFRFLCKKNCATSKKHSKNNCHQHPI